MDLVGTFLYKFTVILLFLKVSSLGQSVANEKQVFATVANYKVIQSPSHTSSNCHEI